MLMQLPSQAPSGNLLDGDLAWLKRLGLGDGDAENAILQASLDIVMVDADWERERAAEAAVRPFGYPVMRTPLGGLRNLLFGFSLGDCGVLLVGRSGFGLVVLDRRLLVAGSLLSVDDLWLFTGVAGGASRAGRTGGAGLVALLRVAGNGQGVVFGPFDIDLGLVQTG